jgi:CBS domain containing-hemolysin-like protein
MVTLTGFILEQFPDIKGGDTVELADFAIKPLDFKDAYINEFEIVRLNKAE